MYKAVTAAVDIWFVNWGLKLHDMTKSFPLGGLSIHFYGCIIALGMLMGFLLATRLAKKNGQDPAVYEDLVIIGIPAAIIGARIYYVANSWASYKDDLVSALKIWEGGLAFYGGLIGAVLATAVYCRIKKVNVRLALDTAAPAILLGQAIGRWSNFVNMECFGSYTENFFAMRLNVAHVTELMLSGAGDALSKAVTVDGVTFIQVHPTFLYESLWCLTGVFLLLLLFKHKRFDGQVILGYLMWYGLGRFWIEGLRTDPLLIGQTDIPISQALSALLVITGLLLTVHCLRRKPVMRPLHLKEKD